MKTLLSRFFFGTALNDNKVLNLGWLLFRLHIGLSIAIHAGWPKMNTLTAPGWFNDQVAGLGFRFPSPSFWATLASWGEFAGGIGIALGFLTRFNALQLAIQFFVISFLWYKEPEPLTGMYFQNTLFMGFVLLVFSGAGRYSLDRLIIAAKKPLIGPAIKTATAMLCLFLSVNIAAQNRPLRGSGTVLQKKYGYENFDRISIRDLSGVITVETGKPFAVSADIDDNLSRLLRVTLAEGELRMELEGNEQNRLYIESTHIHIRVSLPVLKVLDHSANSDITVTGIQNDSLFINCAGNGDVILKGTTGVLEIDKSGNGDVKAEELLASRVRVRKTGNGDVFINTPNPFFASGTGNGDVVNRNTGTPGEGASIDGNGEIRYKGQSASPETPALKRVQVRINNETGEWLELQVKFPGRGLYGIDLKAYGTMKESVPVGTRFYREGQPDAPLYVVTAEEKQHFTISKTSK